MDALPGPVTITMGMTMRKLLTFGVAMAALAACKTPNSGSQLRDDSQLGPRGASCAVGDTTWAGRMGMKLKDGGDGAIVDCVVVGEGLHHIGLKIGDKITSLNNDTKVASAAGFEQAASQVAKAGGKKRVARWEFSVVRGGQNVKVKPLPEYPGCGLYVYDDCGPLGQ